MDTHDLTADQATDFSKVYILSLPAFTWIQVTTESAYQRAAHTCRTIGNRQMISIGGVVNANSTFTDPWANGLGIFDMTGLTWTSNYDATTAPYVPSKPVAAYYNSSSRYPSAWASQDLKAIFQDTGATTVTTNGTKTGVPAAKKSNVGAIAGGAIGGLALIAVVGCACFFLWRRSRKEKARLVELSASQPAFYDDNAYTTEMDTQEPKYQLGSETTRRAEMGSDHSAAYQPLMRPVELDSER
jgi:hypothetical protein